VDFRSAVGRVRTKPTRWLQQAATISLQLLFGLPFLHHALAFGEASMGSL
jgi:hypothetical protein